MATQSKTLNLFLLDGEPTGRVECKLSNNWSGIAYKIPRDKLNEGKDLKRVFKQVEGTGVYFLFGRKKDKCQTVYVGQAVVRQNKNGLLSRVREHNSKDWTEAVLFTRKDDTFGPTEVSYLEFRFHELALGAKRYQVLNGNTPNPGMPPKEIILELEEFIVYAKIMMEVLGHKVFVPKENEDEQKDRHEDKHKDKSKSESQSSNKRKDKDKDKDKDKVFSMKWKNGKARGKSTSDGFLILKGSVINPETTKSCPKNALRLRSEHADKINDAYELTSDILMTSPSTAAGFIAGTALNGNQVWRDSKGQPLKQTDKKI